MSRPGRRCSELERRIGHRVSLGERVEVRRAVLPAIVAARSAQGIVLRETRVGVLAAGLAAGVERPAVHQAAVHRRDLASHAVTEVQPVVRLDGQVAGHSALQGGLGRSVTRIVHAGADDLPRGHLRAELPEDVVERVVLLHDEDDVLDRTLGLWFGRRAGSGRNERRRNDHEEREQARETPSMHPPEPPSPRRRILAQVAKKNNGSGGHSSRVRGDRDSNPGGTCAPNGFQDRRLRPLGHPPGGQCIDQVVAVSAAANRAASSVRDFTPSFE